MKIKYFLSIVIASTLFFSQQIFAAETPRERDFAQSVGGSSNDYGRAISIDNQGNRYVAGYFQGTATFGGLPSLTSNGGNDIFITKISNTGQFLRAKKAGGVDYDIGYGIDIDSEGNSYVAGLFKGTATFGGLPSLTSNGGSDVFITKISNVGQFLRAKKAGGIGLNEEGSSISVDSEGNSYVVGRFSETATFGGLPSLTSNGGSDVFITKISNVGQFLRAKKAGGDSNDQGNAISVDSEGNSYVAGYFYGTANFGDTILVSSGSFDIFITKISNTGQFLWAKKTGGAGWDIGYGIDVDSEGSSYVVGIFEGTTTFGGLPSLTSNGGRDIFVTKLSNTGQFLRAKKAGGINYDYGNTINIDSEGNSYVVGYFSETATFGGLPSLTSNGGSDVFITKISNDGQFLWAEKAGGTGWDAGYGIDVDSEGNRYVAGYFSETATFGGLPSLTSNGLADIFVAKIGPSGEVLSGAKEFTYDIYLSGHKNNVWTDVIIQPGEVYDLYLERNNTSDTNTYSRDYLNIFGDWFTDDIAPSDAGTMQINIKPFTTKENFWTVE